MDLTYDQNRRLCKMIDDYKAIGDYMNKTESLDYVQFDYDVVHGLSLFMLDPNFDFKALEMRTDTVLNALPAIKRIFAQPCIHLIDQDIILPVEAVRTVNNSTLTHIASHSELWSDVKSNEIKPEKLLTRTYDDNYAIYENLVFCNVVDEILSFTRSNIRFLQEVMFTNKTIEINLLERLNHLNYFLALGKLHIGYSKNFVNYYADAVRCLNKLQFISNTIAPRLKRPVYKNNRSRPVNIKLRKTNILSMHKEYHQVYKLARYLALNNVAPVKELTAIDVKTLQNRYSFFCRALCLFSIGHFNFKCDEKKKFRLDRLSLSFTFKNWKLDLKNTTQNGRKFLLIEIVKDKPYRIVLIPSLQNDADAVIQDAKKAICADEYLVCSPYEEHDKCAVLIDVTSIESFRRLQQIILRGMIYADDKKTDCPFCNNDLSVNSEKSTETDSVYECLSCRTEIHEKICPSAGKKYFYTDISGYRSLTPTDETRLSVRAAESALYFRNITDIDSETRPICPHCGKIHE